MHQISVSVSVKCQWYQDLEQCPERCDDYRPHFMDMKNGVHQVLYRSFNPKAVPNAPILRLLGNINVHMPEQEEYAPEKPIIMKNLRTMPMTNVTLASVNAGTSSHILCK